MCGRLLSRRANTKVDCSHQNKAIRLWGCIHRLGVTEVPLAVNLLHSLGRDILEAARSATMKYES